MFRLRNKNNLFIYPFLSVGLDISSDTVVNQRQREVTSDRTDNSKRVESTGCLNQDATHSNVSANSRDLPPQGNG